MGLKEGNLLSLVRNGCSIPITDLGTTVFHHMLQAIDFLTMNGIVHRDIKPENILYVSRPGQYEFQLGDFGLSNRQIIATTFAGSVLYMAPEMFQTGEQTHKADIWSLYVTMLWVLDVEGFRDASGMFVTSHNARTAVLSVASSTNSVSVIREMARPEPAERACAAQMLVKCFDGHGLTTPRNKVPPLVEADSKGPARPMTPPKKPGDITRNANPPAAAAVGRLGVERAPHPPIQPRQPVGPGPERRPGQLGARTSTGGRIPGVCPTVDAFGTLAEARRQHRFT